MNKKYIISNSEDSSEFLTYYLFYIILICMVVCLFININNYNDSDYDYDYNYDNENFGVIAESNNNFNVPLINSNTPNLNQDLININEELTNKLNTLEEKLSLQNRLQHLSNNYLKINESSFPDELKLINLYFTSVDLPEIDLSTYHVISTQADFNALLSEASRFVNIYKPGDVVSNNSSFNIDKNTICYKNTKDSSYIQSHPDCMTCSVNSEYLNTPGWFNTKTNINKVCLFNQNAIPNSGIPNANDCKKLCNINQ